MLPGEAAPTMQRRVARLDLAGCTLSDLAQLVTGQENIGDLHSHTCLPRLRRTIEVPIGAAQAPPLLGWKVLTALVFLPPIRFHSGAPQVSDS
jgi:hypothetical protein